MPEQLLPPQVPWQGGCACAGMHTHEEQGWGGDFSSHHPSLSPQHGSRKSTGSLTKATVITSTGTF